MAAILLAATACEVHRSRPMIALSYPAFAEPYAAVAAALARPGPSGAERPRILYDTADVQEVSEAMVAWAQRVGRMREVVGVVGPSGSRVALATAPVYNDAGIPQVVPMATDRLLAQSGPWTFTMAPDDSVEGAFLADYVDRVVRAQRVLLFYENDEFGQSLRGSLLREFDARGIRVLAQVSVFPNSDFEPLLVAALTSGRPDAVVMATRETEAGAIANLGASRLPRVPMIAADGALVPQRLVVLAGAGLANLRVVAFWVPDTTDARQRAFIAETRRVTGHDPNADLAMIQDGIDLMSAAIDDVGPDRTAIRDWLRSLGRERPAFPGLTGPISFGTGRASTLTMVRVAPDGSIAPEPVR
ncbi:MAG TPA: ABC transporter substrate-binding protein [Gemmatimonadales bacterium]|nr:ABC transporter substrate-binding protein [Gemmatimonadales bacterium]